MKSPNNRMMSNTENSRFKREELEPYLKQSPQPFELKKIHPDIFKIKDHCTWARAIEFSTLLDEEEKHRECTNWFNRVCHATSLAGESIVVHRQPVLHSGSPHATSIYTITCSADYHKSSFNIQGKPFPTRDGTKRAKEFVEWCKNILWVYRSEFDIE